MVATPTPIPGLRVLHVSGRSDHGGGPEHILHVMSAGLSSVVHHVACPDTGVYWQRYADLIGGQRMCALPHRRLSPGGLWRLHRFIRDQDIQVVHSHGTCAGAYARALALTTGVPVVHSFHGVPVTRSLRHGVYALAERLLGHATSYAVAVSASEADLVHARWKHYRGKLVVVPNGIDLGGDPPSWAPWPRCEPLRIVSFTRRNQQKHPELLIEIARILDLLSVPYTLDAYGEGLTHPALSAAAARRGVAERLRFHPCTDAPGQALRGAHIYLSTSRWEGMPLAVLEAWRAGLVVVASDVIGNRDLVDNDRTGLLFPSGVGRRAAHLIRDLASDPQRADILRQRASRMARLGHGRNLMALRLEWLYRRMASGTRQANPETEHDWPRTPVADRATSARLVAIRS